MKPPIFKYQRIEKVATALEALHQKGSDARILAGGQSLMILLNMRLAHPEYLLDISRCHELDYIRQQDGVVQIGACTTQLALQYWPDLTTSLPLLAEALPYISHYQIRSRGTVVGSIAHADPSAELALCLATLGGSVLLQSQKKKRLLKASEFQLGMFTTARLEDELLVEVRFPVARPNHGYAFSEMAYRRGDFAIVAIAVEATPNSIRLGVGGVADKPVVVEWPHLSETDLIAQLNDLAWSLEAQNDQHASDRYRRHLVRQLGLQTIKKAQSRRMQMSNAGGIK